MNISLEDLKGRVELTEKKIIGEQEDRSLEMIQFEKEKEWRKMNRNSETCETPSNIPKYA